MDWGEAPIRIFIAGITLLAVCSSLLGVLVGWWLRGREVKELQAEVNYLQGELRKCWAKKTRFIIPHEDRRSGEN